MVIIDEADELYARVVTHVPHVRQHAGEHDLGALVLGEAEAARGDRRDRDAAAAQLVGYVKRVIDGES